MTIAVIVLAFLLGASLLFNWHMVRECRFYEQATRFAQESVYGNLPREKIPGVSMPKEPAPPIFFDIPRVKA